MLGDIEIIQDLPTLYGDVEHTLPYFGVFRLCKIQSNQVLGSSSIIHWNYHICQANSP